ncbi:MAG TPA: penicillin-binding transpeptidase domain-containing protein [Acidimicrobiales bacterium]|nr:penicillin-binding transpeptidase domain-containing protein [Acidimicrobiales bacterium]
MGRRIRWLGLVMVCSFALVIVQLVNIQFRRAPALASSPFNPRVAELRFDNMRGVITASDGSVLAKSVKAPSGTYHYMRVYPQGPLFAGVTGFSDSFYGTPGGIEYQYNQYLESHPQSPQNLSQLIFAKPPSEPDNITLTLDPVLQKAAMTALTTLPPSANKDGAVVVLNPTTGAVLAMVSNPTFDPNVLASTDVATQQSAHYQYSLPDRPEGFKPLQPIATEERFPPGSTFKVVTSTAAYNLKPSLADYSFPPAVSISFPDSNKTLSNDGLSACGGPMIVMLPESCDPGYAELGVKLGAATMTKQAQLFGFSIFGTPNQTVPNLDLPGVVPSTFTELPTSGQALLAYSSIGQENDTATALQNALVVAGIANGGVIMTPHLMEQIRDSQGNLVASYQPTPMLRTATQAAAASVDALMLGVATHGTAAGVGFPNSWNVAVKTGTAQVQAPTGPEQTDDWMIGFMPGKGTPKVAIAVVVPYQSFSVTGAEVAGPIVKAVLQAYVNEAGTP